MSYAKSTAVVLLIVMACLPVRKIAGTDEKAIIPSGNLSGRVVSSRNLPVAGATVHLVPTTAIDMTPITASDVYYSPYPADAYDEPLEDAIAAKGAAFAHAITDASGHFSVRDIPDGKFFVHVTLDPEDRQHLPGGDKSRESFAAEELRGGSMTINVSSRPPEDATYVGSTACLECHEEYETWKQTGHKLAWAVPGAPGPMQDFSRFPDYFKSLEAWIETDEHLHGTHLELGDYNPKAKGSVKFKLRLFEDARVPIETVFADVYLWKRKVDSEYLITMVNSLNPGDPSSPVHLPVEMVYGGAVHRQRFMVSVPASLAHRQGIYTLLQFNPDGRDNRLDVKRRVWRDYKFSYWWNSGEDQEYGTKDDKIAAPDVNSNTIQAMCAGCHVTGYERYTDPATGQVLIRGVNDPNGSFNIDDDPEMDEVNVGCEACHGPGSEHAAYAGVADHIELASVNPKYLSAERSSAVCGRCHDRRKGIGGPTLGYTQPINEDGKLMPPGESRHTMITEYSETRGPIPRSQVWNDDVHSRNPHQQYPDLMKSGMYRNDRQLVACSDCHNVHGGTPYRRSLIHDPDDPDSPLCQRCHEVNMLSHMSKQLNSQMKGLAGTTCIDCHMPGTMVHGGDAGAYGRFINTPSYDSSSEEQQNAYWEGHINSHVFDVPRKTNVGVKGVHPGLAMPIPYTNSCGTCHVVDELPHK